MPMTPHQERWAEALAIERWKGDAAHPYIAEHIAALAIAGDEAGVKRFREIAFYLDQLSDGLAPRS